VPARGIGAIPEQLAAGLVPAPSGSGPRWPGSTRTRVELASGERVAAAAVVVAAEAPAAARLAGDVRDAGAVSTTALWYDAPASPVLGAAGRAGRSCSTGTGRGP
jgi:hypothetical protein